MNENSLKTSTNCHHFVVRKKRHCRMTVIPGGEFCAEHQPPIIDAPNDEEPNTNNNRIRIVCPLDRKHTCYAHNLRKHLKICNARPAPTESYIEKNVNSGRSQQNNDEEDTFKFLSTFSPGEIAELVTKINVIYKEKICGNITERVSKHNVVEEEMAKPEYGDRTLKHLKQASSILGLLSQYNLITDPNTCYIEFGAGRGQLSYWLAQATPNSTFLLVERGSPKHKRDNKLDKSEDKVQRIRADIADLVLDKVDVISKCNCIVGVTKHLCGEATDLAIRCLTNVERNKDKISGCLMTFCCHHRCRWLPYTGKEFFEQVALTKNDFDMMCGMSSWATCGSGMSREKNNQDKGEEELPPHSERDKEIGLNRQEKEEIGKRCKSILNWGRLKFLEQNGFECFLHFYVEKQVSLENVCIVAFKKNVEIN